jgi:hypothetical protein
LEETAIAAKLDASITAKRSQIATLKTGRELMAPPVKRKRRIGFGRERT